MTPGASACMITCRTVCGCVVEVLGPDHSSATRLEAGVEAIWDAIPDLSDDAKRLLLEALDIRVRVYRQGHAPRVIVDGAVPLDAAKLLGTYRSDTNKVNTVLPLRWES